MKQWKKLLSLLKLQSKNTVKPLAIILTLMFFVEGSSMLYNYKISDFSISNEYGFDAMGNAVSYKNQPMVYQFEEVLKHCHIDLIFLIGTLTCLVVFVMLNLRRKSIIAKKVTYQQLPVSKHMCLNILLLHTIVMMLVFLVTQFLILKFWHEVYTNILPNYVVMEQSIFLVVERWDFLSRLFPFQNDMAIVMNLAGLIYIAVTVIYLPMIRRAREKKILYCTLGIGSYLLLGGSTFIVGSILQTIVFILLSRLMYVEVYRKLYIRKDVDHYYAAQKLNLAS